MPPLQVTVDSWEDESRNANPDFPEFDLAEVPQPIEAEDGLPQEMVYTCMQHYTGGTNHNANYQTMPVKDTTLAELRDTFQNKRAAHAMRELTKKRHLRINEELKVPIDHPYLLWDPDGHFLDYILLVSRGIGLGACLPSRTPSSSFSVTIKPSPGKGFQAKHGKLGFDPTGAMLYLGSCPTGQLWIGMCPKSQLEVDEDLQRPFLKRGLKTQLEPKCYRRLYMFLTFILSGILDLGIQISHHFGTKPGILEWKLSEASNARPEYTLNYHQVQKMDRLMVKNWDLWVERAPQNWKDDGWLQNHVPVSVVYRYGQNQRIGENMDQEVNNWDTDFDLKRLRYITVALATHLSATLLPESAWEEKPLEEVMDGHDNLYDSPDPDSRQIVDLNTYPLRDPTTHQENRVYSEEGIYVPRVTADVDNTIERCGILLKLNHITQLFEDGNEEDPVGNRRRTPVISVYPQAFLKNLGHIQAHRLIRQFDPILGQINADFGRTMVEEEDEEAQELFGTPPPPPYTPPVVEGESCQFYNHLSHRTRQSEQTHEVQQGKITAVLSGSYATTTKGKTTFRERKTQLERSFPHETFANQIDSPSVYRDLRLENVVVINIYNLNDEIDSAGELFRYIIMALCLGWLTPEVVEALKEHLFLFTPQAFPSVYVWTTYPICAILERTYQSALQKLNQGLPVSPDLVEIAAVFERALAYAHTGNAKVLSHGLMQPMWLARSVLSQGLPILGPLVDVLPDARPPVTLPLKDWPLVRGVPVCASQRVQYLTYGESHYKAFLSHLAIKVFTVKPPPSGLGEESEEMRNAIIAARIGVSAYIDDVKHLVQAGVLGSIKGFHEEGDDLGERDADIMAATLRTWLDHDHPLSWDGYGIVIRAILRPSKQRTTTPPKIEAVPVRNFIDKIVKMATPEYNGDITTPLLKSGNALGVFRVVLQHLQSLSGFQSQLSPAEFTATALYKAISGMKINLAPWPRRVAGPARAGKPPTTPLYNSWISLGVMDRLAFEPLGQDRDPLGAALEQAQRADPNANWNLSDVTLQDLRIVAAHRRLPEDAAPSKEKDDFVQSVYNHVRSKLDLSNEIHHLFFLVAFTLCKSLPRIHLPDQTLNASTPEQMRQGIRNLNYVEKKGRGGASQEDVYFVCALTWMIGLWDTKSPLREAYDKNPAKGLGSPWCSRHTAKGLTPVQLIKLGLARPLSNRVKHGSRLKVKGKQGGDWEWIMDGDLKEIDRKLVRLLQVDGFGPYNAVREIMGQEAAEWVAREKGGLIPNPGVTLATSSTSSTDMLV